MANPDIQHGVDTNYRKFLDCCDDYNAALSGLVLGKAAIDPVHIKGVN
jgi:hypothetical protein